MKKKIVSLCLVVALAATAVIGGSLAYFTDTEQANNTMVIGDVEINIEELAYDWEAKDYVDFKDAEFTLYPIDNEQGGNLFNKLAYTFNSADSKDDAYIRTIVLVENNSANICEDDDCCLNGIHYAYNGKDTYTMRGATIHGSTNQVLGVMNVDGKDYQVVVFTEKNEKAIPYGEALESFNSIWMDKNTTQTQAANWGEEVEIVVFSQAIQATGLTHEQAMTELGEINATNLSSWIDTEDAVINDFWNYKKN